MPLAQGLNSGPDPHGLLQVAGSQERDSDLEGTMRGQGPGRGPASWASTESPAGRPAQRPPVRAGLALWAPGRRDSSWGEAWGSQSRLSAVGQGAGNKGPHGAGVGQADGRGHAVTPEQASWGTCSPARERGTGWEVSDECPEKRPRRERLSGFS